VSEFKVGVQLHPQHTSVDELLAAAEVADELGVDSIWVWDHFFPLYATDGPYDWPPASDLSGSHFESWTLLAAMARGVRRAHIGVLISNIHFRNPDLMADMARTIDHLSGGRFILGLGAGNLERDFVEYGYEFADGPARLSALEEGIKRIHRRFLLLDPAPLGRLPLLVGGSGAKVTLRIVAQYADLWNSFGPPEEYEKQNRALDGWCEKLDRDPSEIERTVLLDTGLEIEGLTDFLAAGANHIIVGCGHPFVMNDVQRLLDARDG
jgi:probable F420-dependent oxidoreductase